MIYSILFAILAAISYGYWRYKFIPAEVAQNAADFVANGAADNLQRGYHGRETWSRIWPGLACCVVPSLSFALSNLTSCLLSFLAMAALLAGAFARDFTPKLNLARIANGDTWLSEWYASPASKSWPDAACWKRTRNEYKADPENCLLSEQEYANLLLLQLLNRTWLWARLAAGALAVAAVVVAATHNS